MLDILPEPATRVWTIRAAEVEDAPRLVAYYEALANEPFNNTSVRQGYTSLEVADTQRMIAHHRDDPQSCILVAEVDEEIVGYVRCTGGSNPFNRHTADLSINVRVDFRGIGIGSALMSAALAWARAHETISRVQLTVLARNTGAIKLYERMGFEMEGRLRNAYRLPDEGDIFVDMMAMAYHC
ncbi:MAG: GNAT family N-acetyltransferase [Anaerolineae bacterium]|nr:GNAT family N-acetyltransferase [Anaerolineae bacterium]